MVAKINADTSGGLKLNSDTSGTLEIQSAGTTKLTVSSAGVAMPGPLTGLTSINSGQIGGSRNKVMNGAMVIDQRNAGASVTPTNGLYTLDRWQGLLAQASKYTVIQSATAPTGFIESLLVTSSSAYSLADGDYFDITQYVEGQNMADLAWGTASAATVTLSFYVRSSLTGTFGGSLQNNGQARSYPFSYAISSADTWEKKSITIAGDTSGTWLTTNGRGIQLNFSLGTGATFSGSAGSWAGANYLGTTSTVSVVSTNAATWYVTGVQLEKGSTATDFESRSFGEELALCQRYFETAYDISGGTYYTQVYWSGDVTSGATYYSDTVFQVAKRNNAPTVTTFRLGENGFTTAAPTVGVATHSGFSANKAANVTGGGGNYIFSYSASSEL